MDTQLLEDCFGRNASDSTCPARGILSFSPLLLLWITLPIQYYSYSRLSRNKKLRSSNLHLTRIVFFVLLIVCESAILFWSTIQHVSAIRLALAVFNVLSYALSLLLYTVFSRRGQRSNGSLFVSFLLLAVVQLIDFLVLLFERPLYEQDIPIQFLLVMAETVLLSLNEKNDYSQKRSPEENCGFFSRLLLTWINPLVAVGSKKDLELNDLYPVVESARSETLVEKWNVEWERTKAKCEKTGKEPSVVYTLFNGYKSGWIAIMTLRLIADVIQFMNPILLKFLIDFVADDDAPISMGIMLALSMFLFSEIRSFCMNSFLYVVIQYSVKIQSILTNAIFRKTLRLSTSARNSRTVGEIVNFMAIDVEKMIAVLPFIHNFWSAPLQISIAMAMLWYTLGPSAIGGILLMTCFIPLNYFSSKFIKKCQIKQMNVKDERTKMCNEVLSGMKLIKLYAWEEAFETEINNLRAREVKLLGSAAMMGRAVDAANVAAPFLVAVVSFGTYVLSSPLNVLTPQKAFVSLALFNQIRQPMRIVAMFINNLVQAMVSNKRLKKFLNEEEMRTQTIPPAPEDLAVYMNKFTTNWSGPEADANISEISFSVEKGSLIAVVGGVGSGKSSLLAAILGEMYHMSGKIGITGSIAYSPQQAWLQNMTVRDNIIYGKPYERIFYQKVCEACELNNDFALFPHSDLTEVGENGITLSGGQKARIGLARAIYQQSDIYLMDDVLSAVDAHVGTTVFEKVISTSGLLAGKTRILVTHGLQYTKTADLIVVMHGGKVHDQGTYHELASREGEFASLLKEYHQNEQETDSTETETDEESTKPVTKKRCRLTSAVSEKETKKRINIVEPKLIKKETVETGRVSTSVYWMYMKASTIRLSSVFFVFMVIHYFLMAMRSIWLSTWADSTKSDGDSKTVGERLGVYALIGLVEVFAVTSALGFLVMATMAASLNLHSPLLHSILRSPMHFFDTTPVGRILNRLGRDIEVIDTSIPVNVRQFSQCALQTVTVLCLISYSTPIFIVAIIPLTIFYFWILHYFLPTARQLKRLESVNRSPILSTFGESITGATSIRAYDKVDQTCEAFSGDVDKFTRCRYLTMATNRWLAIRLELLGNSTVLLAGLFAVISTRWGGISPGLVGLSVSFALSITEQLNLAVRMMSELETNIVSVERVKEYSNLEEEMEWHSDCPPDDRWPSKGTITWDKYATRYRKGLPLVVKNLNFTIEAGQKVAVVGRTGSGKSSLTLGLFRLIEPAEGRIVMDNVDIYNIGLHDVRAKLTIIPQEPVLFSGSLRFNLDPFGKYGDDELWSALEACQLREFVNTQSEGRGLDFHLAEGGKNMSVGQRQLVCLGRALLRKGRILILDEATAAVDVTTDSLVQEVIRDKFADSTVIAIAHRINTVANYDKILVLEKGEVAEFDTPVNLLQDENSRYSRMVEKSKTQ